MPLAVEKTRLRSGHVGGEPAAVAIGDETILRALPHRDGPFDRLEREAPVGDERAVVVEPAPDVGFQRSVEETGHVLRELAARRLGWLRHDRH